MKIGTVADLIHYRVQNERHVERINECPLPTEFGDFRLISFQDTVDNQLHFALVCGQVDQQKPVLVRVHMQNTLSDLFGVTRTDTGLPLRAAMQRIAHEGTGVLVVLRGGEENRDLVRQIQEYGRHGPWP